MSLIIPNSFGSKTTAQLGDIDENFNYLASEIDSRLVSLENTVPTLAPKASPTFTGGITLSTGNLIVNSNIGIGTSNPTTILSTVSGNEWNISSRSSSANIENRNHLLFQRSLGSPSNPTAVTGNTKLGGISFGGYDGTSWSNGWNGGAEISALASNSWTSSDRGGALIFSVTPIGTTTLTEAVRINNASQLMFNSGYGSVAVAYGCRAWVNFNGTGTVAIRGSGNVSSITDNGTGDYTINFSTAMPDTNFSANITATGVVATYHCVPFIGSPGSNDTSGFPNTSSFRFSHYNITNSGLRGDPEVVCVAIYR